MICWGGEAALALLYVTCGKQATWMIKHTMCNLVLPTCPTCMADVYDDNLDSAVFLKAGSLDIAATEIAVTATVTKTRTRNWDWWVI